MGPSELLGELEVTRFSDDDFRYRYLVGETEAGLVTAQMSGSWYEGYQARLNYREKTGDITLAPLENYWGSTIEGDGGMAYFLAVTDLPGAVYGELDLTVQVEGGPVEEWELTAELEDGFFLFAVEGMGYTSVLAIGGWLYAGLEETAYTLHLYDREGDLLGQRSWSYAQAWAEQQEERQAALAGG